MAEVNSMGDVLVRNLEDAVIRKLKRRARGHSRSLQAEVKEILEQAARYVTMSEAQETALEIRRNLADHTFMDSVGLLVEDRGR
jgi:plasmid stability protein